MKSTLAALAHEPQLKQEQRSPIMALQRTPSSSLTTHQTTVAANTSDMTDDYYQKRMVTRSELMVLPPTAHPERLPTTDSEVAAMIMNRAEIERRWLEAEQQMFRLVSTPLHISSLLFC
jgi:hypothetical protein